MAEVVLQNVSKSFGADLAVLGVACRNDLKKVGELPDQLLGVGKHIFRRVFVGARVRAKETVRSLAKPGNDLFIAGGFENLSQSVERVGGAAVGRFFAGLAPLVKEGRGYAQIGRNRLYADVLHRMLEDFVRLHCLKARAIDLSLPL